MLMLFRRSLLILSAICLIQGCGNDGADYSKVDLVGVTGKITLDGKPVAAAVITFESTETGSFSGAMSNADGTYELRFDSAMMGVTPGKKLVKIGTARRILGISSNEEAGEASTESGSAPAPDDSSLEQIPDCYHKDSKLIVDVTSSTQKFDFNLKSDCSTTGAE